MRADGRSRSSLYAAPETTQREAATVAQIRVITDEFAAYGSRHVGAELRHRRRVVNTKKVRRLMKEHDLNPRRRRWTCPTNSERDGLIFPFVAKHIGPGGPTDFCVADLPYLAIAAGFM
jgi:putative transposase